MLRKKLLETISKSPRSLAFKNPTQSSQCMQQERTFHNEIEIDSHLNKKTKHMCDKNDSSTKSTNFIESLVNTGNTFHEKVQLGYSREQMCALVFDVKNYSKFLPWCINSEILVPSNITVNKTIDKSLNLNLRLLKKNSEIAKPQALPGEEAQLPKSFKARLVIGYPPFKESYISHVSMVRPYQITSISRDTNLFEYLINEWKFHPSTQKSSSIETSCIVEFYVSFKFRSVLYSKCTGIFMDQIFGKMVEAFTDRAQVLHGRPSMMPVKIK